MGLKKWDPFKDLVFLQERMSRIFDEAFSHSRGGAGLLGGAWFPSVDIYETDDEIILKAELPGIDIKSVSVEVEGNCITLKGERRFEKNLSEENYHRMERFYGAFHRVFTLPYAVDSGGIKASLKDGVLKITVPKHRAEATSSVKVKVQ